MSVATRSSPVGKTHRDRRFFVWISLAMLFVIALGFGKSFYLRPLFSDKSLPTYLVVHGFVMTAWYLLFLVQVSLVSVGRTDLHRKFGIAGAVIAAAVVVSGLYVDLNIIPRRRSLGVDLSTPEALSAAAQFALASMMSLVVFGGLVALAVALRRSVGVHRRLMFWAFVWTLGPAFTNTRPLGQMLDPLVAPYLPFFPADFIWLALLLAYDWKTERRFHPATYLGFAALVSLFIVGDFWLSHSQVLQEWLIKFV